jgi:sugar phosphate permease
VAYAVGQFAAGALGDRIGPRRLVGAGMIASAVLTAWSGASATALGLALSLTLNGAAQATGWPGTVQAMAPCFGREQRGWIMGLWSTCYQVGGLAAGALAAALLKGIDWRAAYTLPALWVALVGGLVLVALPEAPRVADGERRAARTRLIRDPVLWSLGLAYFCLKLIRYSLLFWLPFYLERSLGYARGVAGYQSLAFEVGGIAGAVLLGFVSDRWLGGRRGLAGLLGCLTLALALLLYLAVGHLGPGWNFAALAVVGLTLIGPDALLSGAAAQDLGGPAAAATAAGFVNGMGSVGAILEGVITAEVSVRLGWSALFWVFFGLALLAALACIPCVRAERRRATLAA